jgi:hypothetical protein
VTDTCNNHDNWKNHAEKIAKKQIVKVNSVLTLLIGISLASHAFKIN